VGVIGLGSMGSGVAKSLLRAGFVTQVCDTRPEAVAALTKEGAVGCATPAELGSNCDVVVVLVVNAAQTEAVLFGEQGAAAMMRPETAVIVSATVAPSVAINIGTRLAAHGVLMVDGPISGGAAKAASGDLTIMASGNSAAFARCGPVLEAIAAKVYRLGDTPGTGSRVKMINQLLAGVHIAAAAEAIALGVKAGADPAVLYEVICNSAGNSWMFQNRVPHILAGDYSALSTVNIFVKDLSIVLDAARQSGCPVPLTAAAHQMFMMAAAAGFGSEDDSAVVKIFPGVDLPKPRPQ
jgi:putative dehydrogenase